jgi:chemotaxis receptor (MCP) glutamine deamidase CheD
MTASSDQRTALYLKPGEWFFGGKRCLVRTILGACVAVTWQALGDRYD